MLDICIYHVISQTHIMVENNIGRKNKVQPRIWPVTAEMTFPSVCLSIEIEVVGASYFVRIANGYPIEFVG